MTEADGRQVNYTYDELYRLTEENINNGERILAYTYDSVGNRLTKDDSLTGLTTYTYDANDRLLSEVLTQSGVTIHTITYTYDDNGNLVSRTQVTDAASETTTYTWNDDDRLVAVATPDGSSVTYEYDEQGIRVSSTVDGVTTDYLIDKNRPYAQVLEELNSEQLQAFYVYGHDLISQTRNTQQDFYQVDGLGSTRALADENGNVTDTYDYEAFGELIESSGESENSYQFAGEQFDEALGDYYLRDRFYDPSSGRFTRRDTWQGDLTNPISLHKYLYGHGNPVNLVDPSGLAALSLGELTTLFAVAALLTTYTSSAIQLGPPPESLGGFGEGPQPDIPRHTGHSGLLGRVLEFGRLGGFGEGSQPSVPTHTGYPRTSDDLIRYLFAEIWNDAARDIAYGHAWGKHRTDSWVHININTQQELAEHLDNIITFSAQRKDLSKGREAIWDEDSGTLIIIVPKTLDPDGGTAYRPPDGKAEYDRLK